MNQAEFKVAVVRSGESYAQLAQVLNVSLQTLYNKIHGPSEFKASEIKKLAYALNLSVDDVNTIFFTDEVN